MRIVQTRYFGDGSVSTGWNALRRVGEAVYGLQYSTQQRCAVLTASKLKSSLPGCAQKPRRGSSHAGCVGKQPRRVASRRAARRPLHASIHSLVKDVEVLSLRDASYRDLYKHVFHVPFLVHTNSAHKLFSVSLKVSFTGSRANADFAIWTTTMFYLGVVVGPFERNRILDPADIELRAESWEMRCYTEVRQEAVRLSQHQERVREIGVILCEACISTLNRSRLIYCKYKETVGDLELGLFHSYTILGVVFKNLSWNVPCDGVFITALVKDGPLRKQRDGRVPLWRSKSVNFRSLHICAGLRIWTKTDGFETLSEIAYRKSGTKGSIHFCTKRHQHLQPKIIRDSERVTRRMEISRFIHFARQAPACKLFRCHIDILEIAHATFVLEVDIMADHAFVHVFALAAIAAVVANQHIPQEQKSRAWYLVLGCLCLFLVLEVAIQSWALYMGVQNAWLTALQILESFWTIIKTYPATAGRDDTPFFYSSTTTSRLDLSDALFVFLVVAVAGAAICVGLLSLAEWSTSRVSCNVSAAQPHNAAEPSSNALQEAVAIDLDASADQTAYPVEGPIRFNRENTSQTPEEAPSAVKESASPFAPAPKSAQDPRFHTWLRRVDIPWNTKCYASAVFYGTGIWWHPILAWRSRKTPKTQKMIKEQEQRIEDIFKMRQQRPGLETDAKIAQKYEPFNWPKRGPPTDTDRKERKTFKSKTNNDKPRKEPRTSKEEAHTNMSKADSTREFKDKPLNSHNTAEDGGSVPQFQNPEPAAQCTPAPMSLDGKSPLDEKAEDSAAPKQQHEIPLVDITKGLEIAPSRPEAQRTEDAAVISASTTHSVENKSDQVATPECSALPEMEDQSDQKAAVAVSQISSDINPAQEESNLNPEAISRALPLTQDHEDTTSNVAPQKLPVLSDSVKPMPISTPSEEVSELEELKGSEPAQAVQEHRTNESEESASAVDNVASAPTRNDRYAGDIESGLRSAASSGGSDGSQGDQTMSLPQYQEALVAAGSDDTHEDIDMTNTNPDSEFSNDASEEHHTFTSGDAMDILPSSSNGRDIEVQAGIIPVEHQIGGAHDSTAGDVMTIHQGPVAQTMPAAPSPAQNLESHSEEQLANNDAMDEDEDMIEVPSQDTNQSTHAVQNDSQPSTLVPTPAFTHAPQSSLFNEPMQMSLRGSNAFSGSGAAQQYSTAPIFKAAHQAPPQGVFAFDGPPLPSQFSFETIGLPPAFGAGPAVENVPNSVNFFPPSGAPPVTFGSASINNTPESTLGTTQAHPQRRAARSGQQSFGVHSTAFTTAQWPVPAETKKSVTFEAAPFGRVQAFGNNAFPATQQMFSFGTEQSTSKTTTNGGQQPVSSNALLQNVQMPIGTAGPQSTAFQSTAMQSAPLLGANDNSKQVATVASQIDSVAQQPGNPLKTQQVSGSGNQHDQSPKPTAEDSNLFTSTQGAVKAPAISSSHEPDESSNNQASSAPEYAPVDSEAFALSLRPILKAGGARSAARRKPTQSTPFANLPSPRKRNREDDVERDREAEAEAEEPELTRHREENPIKADLGTAEFEAQDVLLEYTVPFDYKLQVAKERMAKWQTNLQAMQLNGNTSGGVLSTLVEYAKEADCCLEFFETEEGKWHEPTQKTTADEKLTVEQLNALVQCSIYANSMTDNMHLPSLDIQSAASELFRKLEKLHTKLEAKREEWVKLERRHKYQPPEAIAGIPDQIRRDVLQLCNALPNENGTAMNVQEELKKESSIATGVVNLVNGHLDNLESFFDGSTEERSYAVNSTFGKHLLERLKEIEAALKPLVVVEKDSATTPKNGLERLWSRIRNGKVAAPLVAVYGNFWESQARLEQSQDEGTQDALGDSQALQGKVLAQSATPSTLAATHAIATATSQPTYRQASTIPATNATPLGLSTRSHQGSYVPKVPSRNNSELSPEKADQGLYPSEKSNPLKSMEDDPAKKLMRRWLDASEKEFIDLEHSPRLENTKAAVEQLRVRLKHINEKFVKDRYSWKTNVINRDDSQYCQDKVKAITPRLKWTIEVMGDDGRSSCDFKEAQDLCDILLKALRLSRSQQNCVTIMREFRQFVDDNIAPLRDSGKTIADDEAEELRTIWGEFSFVCNSIKEIIDRIDDKAESWKVLADSQYGYCLLKTLNAELLPALMAVMDPVQEKLEFHVSLLEDLEKLRADLQSPAPEAFERSHELPKHPCRPGRMTLKRSQELRKLC
ncbi:uncharacterized protein MYCFIDRAFT_170706 [Pseudocercospora fijiensis CIRAD86]|uniref:Uncharacterized protein n=1 Tax=Pseudocercospora fijiensis (strain CIRAD86) TaxID=383855 RepID=N1Q8J7_PSEFD|nr:uncharacterized protein MYCFIDRAFT_170706 [Pseudocercospora fijiensis CIRAD86]EME89194.1 hypothetical protein MYCFIDRAFT_170706 [Pseudocercospora fijiensis CIRAD86]